MDDLVRLLNSNWAEQSACASLASDIVAVATVVNTRGSVYRRPGARMIIHSSDKIEGAVSAGCLERDIIANSREMLDKPVLLTYDGSSRDDLLFGLKLGCDGIVQILLEPAASNSLYANRILKIKKILPMLFGSAKAVAALNIFSAQKNDASVQTNISLGTTMLATLDQSFKLPSARDLPAPVIEALSAQMQLLLSKSEPQSTVWQGAIDNWEIAALIEIVSPLSRLLLFGKGQDVDAIEAYARLLGWQVEIFDDRRMHPSAISGLHGSAAVVATHDYERDKKILAALFAGNIGYIGAIGPRLRADKLLAELALTGVPITEKQQQRFYSPAGLDIGAERPEEVALSIVAEIKAALSGHAGGMLRYKQNGIHQKLSGFELESASLQSPSEGLPIRPACSQ